MPENLGESVLSSSIALLALLAVIAVVYLLFGYLRTRRQKDYFEEMHRELRPGRKVAFCGGMYGTLRRVGEKSCDVELKGGGVVEVSRYAIQQLVD